MKKFNLSRKKKIIIGIVVVLLIIVVGVLLITKGRSRLVTISESKISQVVIGNGNTLERKTFKINDISELYNLMKDTKTSKSDVVDGMGAENYSIVFYDADDNELDRVYITSSTKAIIDDDIISSIFSLPFCEHFYSIDKEDGNKILTEITELTGWDTSWCMK